MSIRSNLFVVFQRGIKLKNQLVNRLGEMGNLPMPETFYLVEQTAQIRYLHTIIRFVFIVYFHLEFHSNFHLGIKILIEMNLYFILND